MVAGRIIVLKDDPITPVADMEDMRRRYGPI
jgi:hypothetical protein